MTIKTSQDWSKWKPGDQIASPIKSAADFVEIDTDQLAIVDRYKLLIGAIVPRPIAFISTVNLQGQANLAPFSFFNGVGSNPPSLMVSIAAQPDGSVKDTLKNILETQEFVVNSSNEWLTGPLHQTSAPYDYGVDEMKAVGLTPIPSKLVKAPRVQESAVQFECRLFQHVAVGSGKGSSTVVIGEIIKAHAAQSVYQNGKVDLNQLKPISRLAGASYGTISKDQTFDLQRPQKP